MEHIVFLTGRLAEPSLRRVLAGMADAPFTWEVREIGLQVAGLMTAELIRRRVVPPVRADRILVPGRCRGDLDALSSVYGLPVERGPQELKDIPRHFERAAAPIDLSRHDIRIFAEIVDAPQRDVASIVARARELKRDGADVIDVGCLPSTPFPHLEDAVRALKAAGFTVSVDSLDPDELRRGGKAGADWLLSLTIDTIGIADEVASSLVLIPRTPLDGESLHAAIAEMRRRGRAFYADPILEPVPFGFTASIVRYHALRERDPQVPILMGIGNLTELIEADTSGINALLFGIASELRIGAVLATEVSRHACRAIAEADVARRIMHAARELHSLPKGISDALMTTHGTDPHPDTPQEIADHAAGVRDPSFRIQAAADGLHVYNRDGHHVADEMYALWPKLRLDDDGSHAFYMGAELAKAEIAWRLGKRYVQDQPLDWGVAVPRAAENLEAWHAPGPTLASKRKAPAGDDGNPGAKNGNDSGTA
jgi:dihydropteroate synthase